MLAHEGRAVAVSAVDAENGTAAARAAESRAADPAAQRPAAGTGRAWAQRYGRAVKIGRAHV